MNEGTFYEEMRSFLRQLSLERNGRVIEEIGEGDNLFDLGAVDSFSMIRMIMRAEELTHCTIEIERHELDRFYTLKGLYWVVSSAQAST